MAQTVKNLPAILETRVLSQDWDDPLEKGMAALSSILASRNPGTGLWPRAIVHGVAKSWTQLSD